MKFEAGLLINFGDSSLKNGIHRVVNNYKPSVYSRESIKKLKTVNFLMSGW
jgi:hypothetical protein